MDQARTGTSVALARVSVTTSEDVIFDCSYTNTRKRSHLRNPIERESNQMNVNIRTVDSKNEEYNVTRAHQM